MKTQITPFNVLYPFLNLINNGRVIRVFMEYLLKLIGVLMILSFFVIGYRIIDLASGIDEISVIFAVIILIILTLFLFYCNFQICFYNADQIKHLGDSKFTIIPIFSLLIRMTGELLAFYTFYFGLVIFILSLFDNEVGQLIFVFDFIGLNPYQLIPINLGGSTIFYFLSGIVSGIIILILTQFLAEAFIAIVEIARNTEIISKGKSFAQLSPNLNHPDLIIDEGILSTNKHVCPNCKNEINENDLFCMVCGTKLKP